MERCACPVRVARVASAQTFARLAIIAQYGTCVQIASIVQYGTDGEYGGCGECSQCGERSQCSSVRDEARYLPLALADLAVRVTEILSELVGRGGELGGRPSRGSGSDVACQHAPRGKGKYEVLPLHSLQ